MEYLAYSLMVHANQEATADTEFNLRKFQFNWKKLIRFAPVVLAGLSVMFATVNQAQAAVTGYVRTQGNCLRVRSAPSINAPVVGCLRNGSRLSVVVDTENGFSRLSSGNYVATRLISARPVTGYTPNPGVGGRVILGVGTSGSAVTQVQRTLGNVPVTGYYGSLTERAVRNFQANNGLLVDGKVGPQTRIAMGL